MIIKNLLLVLLLILTETVNSYTIKLKDSGGFSFSEIIQLGICILITGLFLIWIGKITKLNFFQEIGFYLTNFILYSVFGLVLLVIVMTVYQFFN